MGAFEEAKEWLVEKMGMWWPDADEGKLRAAADAWREFGDAVGGVCHATNGKAASLIHHNSGKAIDAFEVFWHRYYSAGGNGWLHDTEQAAKDMAKALDDYADDIAEVKHKINTRLEISAVVIAAGIGLGFLTAGLATGASAAAATAMIEFAAGLGITVSESVATIAAGTLTGVAFGGVESVTVDLAVAQPLKVNAGLQDGYSLKEASTSATDGMILGGAFGAGFSGVRVAAKGGGIRSLLADTPGGGATNTAAADSLSEMGTRRANAAWSSPESTIAVPPKKPGDITLSTGDPVYYKRGSTTVGYDEQTQTNSDLVKPKDGYHDIVVHGNNKGYFEPGRVNASDKPISAGDTHPSHIVEAIKNNPHYDGGPVRLIACHSGTVREGVAELPAAQEVSNQLGVPVMAPTNKVGVPRSAAPGVEPMIFGDGYWRTYLPVTH